MLRYDIDAKERGRDIAETAHPCTEERVHRDQDSRGPQRRGFDDDNYAPPRDFGFAPRESGAAFEASPAPSARMCRPIRPPSRSSAR